ncbi:hypothetical protein PIB30_022019 [Stylosanthes scabra]|uniref:SLL1 protein n=1 Tax=Stylosanthes scabra TaxID=79078 RepID=A0ABU6Y8K7_9FABA|nr:hypothetical protein [Stylosanthes scabra]
MASNTALRSAANLVRSSQSFITKSSSGSRSFHSTGIKRGGHHEPEYMHAKHMYNLDKISNRGLKMSLAVFTGFSIGVAVPVYAVIFQQKKTASG